MNSTLKKVRKIKGITQQQLADNLGVSKAMISMWENNPNEKIPQNRLKDISTFLNVSESDLLSDDFNAENLVRWLVVFKQDFYPSVFECLSREEAQELFNRIREVDLDGSEDDDSKLYIAKVEKTFGNLDADVNWHLYDRQIEGGMQSGNIYDNDNIDIRV